MTRMYFDVPQVREFLLTNGYVASLRDPRITNNKQQLERVDLWVHDGSSRWGKPLDLKANRLHVSVVGAADECEPWSALSSFKSAEEWWTKATEKYKSERTVKVGGADVNVWNLDLYYVHLLAKETGPT